jgi:hypothetical protein
MLHSAHAVVRFTREGWHHWPAAPEERKYLAASHRHLFYVEVEIEVRHNDREIEFHDLLAFCKAKFPTGDFGAASCEMLAQALSQTVQYQWPGRALTVSVFEDNEVGAKVVYNRVPH